MGACCCCVWRLPLSSDSSLRISAWMFSRSVSIGSLGEVATTGKRAEARVRVRLPFAHHNRRSQRLRRPRNRSTSSARATTVSAVSPWRKALARDDRLPSSVLGPVLRKALRRLASIWRNEVMVRLPLSESASGLARIGRPRMLALSSEAAAACRQRAADAARLLPKPQRDRHRVNAELGPPWGFIATAMNFAMVDTAQWNGKLVAHLPADGAWLGKADVVRLAGLPSTDRARLLGDEAQMLLVAKASQLAGAAVGLLSRWSGIR